MDHAGPVAVGHAVDDLLDAVGGVLFTVVLSGHNVVKQLTTSHTRGEGRGRGQQVHPGSDNPAHSTWDNQTDTFISTLNNAPWQHTCSQWQFLTCAACPSGNTLTLQHTHTHPACSHKSLYQRRQPFTDSANSPGRMWWWGRASPLKDRRGAYWLQT